jgi:hypothetical protein
VHLHSAAVHLRRRVMNGLSLRYKTTCLAQRPAAAAFPNGDWQVGTGFPALGSWL